MPLWDGAEVRELRRIADALEDIQEFLRRLLNRPPDVRSIDLMALPTGNLAPGDTGTFTATANANGAESTGATITVVSSDEAVLTVSSDGATGLATVTYTAVAEGTATVTASVTNADGTEVNTGAGNPATFTVAAAVADVTSVDLA